MNKSIPLSNVLTPEEKGRIALLQSKEELISFQMLTNPKYRPNWHHEAIAKELEEIERSGDLHFKVLIVMVPPRHGKSQQCSIDFPAWYLGRNPDKEIITASYSGELAQEFGGKTREKIDMDAFKLIFEDVKLREDERAKGKWRTQQGGSYISVGVGGAITGRGAHILLIDDPIKNREEAESAVYRDKIWNWFTSTAFTRLEPKGVVILVMTRWHLDDLAGRILAHPDLGPKTKVMRFAAMSEFQESNRGQYEPLWPDKYPKEELLDIKSTIGPYDWACLYQGSPILSENQEMRDDWIRRISETVVGMMNVKRYLTIDTAMSKRSGADFTGFCDNRVNTQNFWHLQAWKARLNPEELVNAIFSLHETRRYDKIGIEKTAYSEGLKPFLDAEQRRRNKFLPIVELQHREINKEVRIRGLIPRYASGSVYHIEGQCKELEEEMRSFPVGAHDDVLDATAYQLQIADDNLEIYSPPNPEPFDKHELFGGV